jgi:hypothetical protein
MARNPWLKISPVQDLLKTQSGSQLVNGTFGKFLSWVWIIVQLLFLTLGFNHLRKCDTSSRLIASIAMSAVGVSWLIAIGTLGDHRFRIPTMGFSLLLQVSGIWKLKNSFSKAL